MIFGSKNRKGGVGMTKFLIETRFCDCKNEAFKVYKKGGIIQL